jgi:ABC-2 type transport system permease protein
VSAVLRTRRRRPLAALARSEAVLLMREPAIVFWCVAFPVILVVVIGSVHSARTPKAEYGGLSLIAIYVPTMIAFAIAMVALNALPPRLANYRERGVLRRLQTTPVGAVRVLGAQIFVYLAVALMTTVTLLAVGRVAFNVGLPTQWLLYMVEIALTSVALLSLGVMVASVASTTRVASAIGSILFFPLMFFAGLWVPRQVMGNTLRHISDYTPLGAGVGALQDASHGAALVPAHLAVLVAYAVLSVGLAVRAFRWE